MNVPPQYYCFFLYGRNPTFHLCSRLRGLLLVIPQYNTCVELVANSRRGTTSLYQQTTASTPGFTVISDLKLEIRNNLRIMVWFLFRWNNRRLRHFDLACFTAPFESETTVKFPYTSSLIWYRYHDTVTKKIASWKKSQQSV